MSNGRFPRSGASLDSQSPFAKTEANPPQQTDFSNLFMFGQQFAFAQQNGRQQPQQQHFQDSNHLLALQSASKFSGRQEFGKFNLSQQNQLRMPLGYFDAEFYNSHLWKPEYQRNNRNGGMKNIRCFPYCGAKHYSSGFCGESLILKVKTNCPSQEIVSYAEIALADTTGKDDNRTVVGTVISQAAAREKLRTRDNPFKDWWNGDLREAKENMGASGHERHLAFEFNRSKRGWHYGWVANKYISDSKHIVRALLFVPIGGDFLKCIYVSESPEFRLYSRKPKRSSPNIETSQVLKKPKAEPGTEPEEVNNPQPSKFFSDLTTTLQKNANELGLDFVNSLAGNPIDVKSIDGSIFPDDLFIGDTESIVNGLVDHAKKFKGANVFKMLQKLLLLSKEDFNKYLEKRMSPEASAEAQYQEIIALRAFAAFLLSDDEDVTAELQAKMDNINPFDSNEEVECVEAIKECPVQPKKVDELLNLAKNKFDKFLSTFNLNVDLYSRFTEKNPIFKGVPQETESKPLKIEEKPSFEEEDDTQLPSRRQTIHMSTEVEHFLDRLEGHWIPSPETLKGYDKMYSAMSIPYALRKCYLSITGNLSFSSVEKEGDEGKISDAGSRKSSFASNAPSIISRYNPKLFSAGVIKYTFDGEKRPWPIASPLISTKYDAIAIRAYVQKDDEGREVMQLEHIYRTHKMLRSLRFQGNDQLLGTVKLFEKWLDFDGSIEWTEILKEKISFIRS